MPAGGDVTSFFLPLMASYGKSLQAGEILWWNHQWGFGFPQFAESQTAMLYPPHVILFSLFAPETGYTFNLLIHLLGATLSAFLLGRWLGLSPAASSLCGLVYTGSGFFVLHMAHQWAYTAGMWVPPIVGLTCRLLGLNQACAGVPSAKDYGVPTRRGVWDGWFLALALALQLLAGHFQLACYSLLASGVLVMTVVAVGPRQLWHLRRVLGWLMAVGAGVALASLQVAPTYGLWRLSPLAHQEPGYLREFGVSLVHFLQLLIPTQFRVHPSWRPVLWDPTHTSPEEVLVSVGFTPLVLAALGLRQLRGSPAAFVGLVLVTLSAVAMVAPTVVLLQHIVWIPGFGLFRASARWLCIFGLGAGLLSGAGLDRLRPSELWRSLALGYPALLALALVAAVPGLALSGALGAGARQGALHAWRLFLEHGSSWPEEARTIGEFRQRLQTPASDVPYPSHEAVQLRQQFRRGICPGPILLLELAPVAGLLLALWVLSHLGRWGRLPPTDLVLLSATLELGLLRILSPVTWVPRRPMVDSSPVLRMLQPTRGLGRVAGLPGNLALLAGAAPVPGYRTLDLPVHPPQGPVNSLSVQAWQILAGIQKTVLPVAADRVRAATFPTQELAQVADPLLTEVLYSPSNLDEQGVAPVSFLVVSHRTPSSGLVLLELHEQPEAARRLLQRPSSAAAPSSGKVEPWLSDLRWKPVDFSFGSYWAEWRVVCQGESWLLWSETFHPFWRFIGYDAQLGHRPLTARPSPENWFLIHLPTAGVWYIRAEYRDPYLTWGAMISASVGVLWFGFLLVASYRQWRGLGSAGSP
jgi:hypothetical protein